MQRDIDIDEDQIAQLEAITAELPTSLQRSKSHQIKTPVNVDELADEFDDKLLLGDKLISGNEYDLDDDLLAD